MRRAVINKNKMENYKRYKENNPHKTDAQIIESLAWELKDKVETIHRLLAENKALRIHDVVGQSEVELCECNYPLIRTGTKERPEYCGNCEKDI